MMAKTPHWCTRLKLSHILHIHERMFSSHWFGYDIQENPIFVAEAEIFPIFPSNSFWSSSALSSSESSSEPEEEEDVDEPKRSRGADHAGLTAEIGSRPTREETTIVLVSVSSLDCVVLESPWFQSRNESHRDRPSALSGAPAPGVLEVPGGTSALQSKKLRRIWHFSALLGTWHLALSTWHFSFFEGFYTSVFCLSIALCSPVFFFDDEWLSRSLGVLKPPNSFWSLLTQVFLSNDFCILTVSGIFVKWFLQIHVFPSTWGQTCHISRSNEHSPRGGAMGATGSTAGSQYGDFHKWGYPNMFFFNGKSH